jgi:uncharacterized iron-regulated membrane protein
VTRAALRRLHRWAGLLLALPLIAQAITGAILAGDPFVAAWQGPGAVAADAPLNAPDDLRGADLAAIIATAGTAVPADLVPRRYRVEPDWIVAVDFSEPGRQAPLARVVLDADSMRVLSIRQNPDGFYRWVRALHENLLNGPTGRMVVGWIGIGLLLLALSGVVLWWPAGNRWKRAFIVSKGTGGWQFQRDLHRAAAIWVLPLLVLQAASGVALAFPQTARSVVGLPVPVMVQGRRGDHLATGPISPAQPILAGVSAAEAAQPDAVLQDLRLPAAPGRPMVALMLPRDRRQGAPGAVVSMDPATARVLSVQRPETRSIGAASLDWLRALHYGGGLGPAWRAVICLFGPTLSLLPITGVAMWVLRWRTLRRRTAGKRSGAARAVQ